MIVETLSKTAQKRYRALKTAKGRHEVGLFLAEGIRLVEEALAAGAPIRELFYTESLGRTARGRALLARVAEAGLRIRCLDERSFGVLSDTEHSQGVVALVEMPGWPETPRWASQLVLGLDSVRDPGNLGTVWRTAAWFGVERLVLSPGCVDPHNPKAVRASMGGLFYVPAEVAVDLVAFADNIRKQGGSLIVTAPDGEIESWPVDAREPLFLVAGGEAEGVSPALQEHADFRVRIRRWGAGESLNVAVSVGIFLANWRGWQQTRRIGEG